jgi:hypothetical protein
MPFKILEAAEGEPMEPGKLKNFRVKEDFEKWMNEALSDLDCNLSDLIRTSLLLAVPIIKSCPSIIKRISLEDFTKQ